MSNFAELMKADRPFLTDGGMETWLFFQQRFEAPEFAAIMLLEDDGAKAALDRYFDGFLTLAEEAGTGFVLDTNTWRGCPAWAESIGVTQADLLRMSALAVDFAKDVRTRWSGRVSPILVNGVVGPSDDGYNPGRLLSVPEARAVHQDQISIFARAQVDMVSAITMPSVEESIGITQAAGEFGLPVVVSFTVETDGRLPTGDLLGEAIDKVDAASGTPPAYYMINCAHPDHFRDALERDEAWIARIGGLRANASRLSHAELDGAEELDQGDPEEFGRLHVPFADLLPNLRVVGGCCGTDHRHVGCVSRHLHMPVAA